MYQYLEIYNLDDKNCYIILLSRLSHSSTLYTSILKPDMGCGATKLQSPVTLPDYCSSTKSTVERSSVNQSDNSLIISDEVLTAEHPQSLIEVTDYGIEQQVTSCTEELQKQESFRSKENTQVVDVNKQQTSNQQDIPIVESSDKSQGLGSQHQINELNDNKTSKGWSELQIEEVTSVPTCTTTAITGIQGGTHGHKETICSNDTVINPQQYCSTARSLSQSPRIVSLQVELGFVSATNADVNLLQSKCNNFAQAEVLVVPATSLMGLFCPKKLIWLN